VSEQAAETSKVAVYTPDGGTKGTVPLPKVFSTEVRHDLIRRAVLSLLSARFQPKGRDPMAGKRTSAESMGVGLDLARVPRVKGSHNPASGSGAFVPNVVGGRMAFPPRPDEILHERINDKERRLALRSAIAATSVREMVAGRGHLLGAGTPLPIVVSDEVKTIAKASEFREFLKKMDLWEEAERAKASIRERAGRGKCRGRRWTKPKSILLVTDELRSPLRTASRNFTGVDYVEVGSLNTERLAPGGNPGRLTVWTESAFKKLDELYA